MQGWEIVEPSRRGALTLTEPHKPHHELHRVGADLDQFWVVTVLSNPIRYKRRYELYWRFKQMCEDAGVKLITVEQAFGNRPFMVTEPNNPFHLQVRSVEELWHKENMINMGIRHACAIAPGLGLKVREVAWVDADCRPGRMPRDWFEETWHQLQHYEFVQMWENLIDMDYNFNPIGEAQPSFMANYVKYGTPNPEEFRQIELEYGVTKNGRVVFGRPGLAWAANIEALNAVGGIIDYAILGAGDWYMAHGLVGSLVSARSEYAQGPYMSKMLEWQARAQRWIKRDVGYVSGIVYHDFHGRKALRFYGTRGKILSDCKYNPETDIKYDQHGMLQLETYDERQIKLRDQIRAYFRARNEDSIDL
jgi:hypothetical protein